MTTYAVIPTLSGSDAFKLFRLAVFVVVRNIITLEVLLLVLAAVHIVLVLGPAAARL